MSKGTKDLGVSGERDRDGPDYFGYYRCQVVGLLSQDEDFLPFDSKTSKFTGRGFGAVRGDVGTEPGLKVLDSLFSNGIGTALSDFKREMLKALLRRGVSVLSAEVDEMLRPVVRTNELLAQRRNKMRLSKSTGAESEDDARHAHKKLKDTSSTSATSIPRLSTPIDPALSVDPKNSVDLHNAETAKGTIDSEQCKVNADVKLLLEDDNSELDKIMTKFSDELSARLGHMEQELEELLDGVMSSCRTMTLAEKKQLQKMIKALPPKDLDHIAELVQRSRPADQRSCDEVFVDLEKENNVTLWRLYYYIEAAEKAKKLRH